MSAILGYTDLTVSPRRTEEPEYEVLYRFKDYEPWSILAIASPETLCDYLHGAVSFARPLGSTHVIAPHYLDSRAAQLVEAIHAQIDPELGTVPQCGATESCTGWAVHKDVCWEHGAMDDELLTVGAIGVLGESL